MYPRRLTAAVAFAAAWMASAANAQEVLKPKFQEGAKYKVRETQAVDQTLNIAGMNSVTKVSNTTTAQTEHGQRDEKGLLSIITTVDSIVADFDIGGTKIHFDSADPNAKVEGDVAQLVVQALKASVGLRLTQTIDDRGRVQSVEGVKEGTGLNPDDLKIAFQQDIDQFPADPVKPGDSWERTEEQALGQGQVFTFQRRYTYQGTVDKLPTVKNSPKLDKITATDASVVYSIKPGGGLPLDVKKSDLKVQSSERTLLFDRELGRVVKAKSSVHVTGDLTLSLMGMELPGSLDLKLAQTSEEVE
ncbi:MAG: hypothetical protein WD278_18000 [Pirellulales bacterium]